MFKAKEQGLQVKVLRVFSDLLSSSGAVKFVFMSILVILSIPLLYLIYVQLISIFCISNLFLL